MANVLSELTEQLAKKVGGDDIAKGIIEGFKAQKGVTRSEVQKQVRGLIRNIDTDNAIRKAKFLDNFAEEAEGQMVIKGLGSSKGSSTVSEEQVFKNSNEIPGQISMFADSTGQMHTPGTKISQIKEARKSTMMDNLSEGSDGQMYMNFGYKDRPEPKPGRKYTYDEAMSMSDAELDALSDADVSKYADVIHEHDMKKINAKKQIEGQQSFLVDKNGNLNTEYGVQQQFQQQLRQQQLRQAADAKRAEFLGRNGRREDGSRMGFFERRNAKKYYQNQDWVTNADKYANGEVDINGIAKNNAKSGTGWWDGIPGWAKLGGAAVAGGIAGAVLSDD